MHEGSTKEVRRKSIGSVTSEPIGASWPQISRWWHALFALLRGCYAKATSASRHIRKGRRTFVSAQNNGPSGDTLPNRKTRFGEENTLLVRTPLRPVMKHEKRR